MSAARAFKELQSEWYDRLKADGFDDLESPGGHLRGFDHRTWRRALEDRSKREGYFERALDVLNRYEFENEQQRMIWALHVEGLPVRTIGERVQKHPATVQWTIKQLRLKVKLEGPWKR